MERYAQLLFKQKHPSSWMLFAALGVIAVLFVVVGIDGRLTTQVSKKQASKEASRIVPQASTNSIPVGFLDEANISKVRGWAFDSDLCGDAVEVHLYIDDLPGFQDGGFSVFGIFANRYREDLCGALNSSCNPCNHAWEWVPPTTIEPGVHIARAYAINVPPGDNPRLPSPKYLTKSESIMGVNISASYSGTVIARENYYDYAPTIINDGGTYKMWWCGNVSGWVGDQIFYSTSSDGFSWASPQRVFGKNNWHTCDPSVLKAGNTYYLWTTQASLTGTNNNIYLATSSNGINWTVANGGNPVLSPPTLDGTYGVGQSSVIFKDNLFHVWFTDTVTTQHPTAVFYATSPDGISWTRQNNNAPVHHRNSGETKYSTALNKFIYVSGIWNAPYLYLSNDGITWDTTVRYRLPETLDDTRTYAHNQGTLGDPHGFIGRTTIAYWGAGLDDRVDDGTINNSTAPTWDIDATIIEIDPDFDNDGIIDSFDNCPSWSNPDQSLPTWYANSIPRAGDSDCDMFTGEEELFLGTDPFRACPATTTANDEPIDAWPPDFNDNGVVQIDDVFAVSSRFGAKEGDANYTKRAELASQNGVIGIDDVFAVSGRFNTSCLP